MKALDPLSDTLFALADPTRRAILARLAEGEANVNEIAAPFDISLPAISRHLKVLEHAGITDILTKNYGSTNSLNVVKATMIALSKLRNREQTVALRGVTLE